MGRPENSIIIPVYNERENIASTAAGIVAVLGEQAAGTEILFVDDDSPDGTAAEIVEVGQTIPQVRLVQHGRKEGIGAAHNCGYQAAKGRLIFCMDADLSQSPADLLRFKHALDSGSDVVVGSRYLDGGAQSGKSLARDYGSRGMNIATHFLLGIPLTDATHTFRAFRREVFQKIGTCLNDKGHPGFQIQFIFFAIRYGFRVTEIPVQFVERRPDQGVSKLSIRREIPGFAKVVGRLFAARLRLALLPNPRPSETSGLH
ncbi:uncharacterized protein METZ01_LOCUS74423 [marine metagenome]|uniref:Glycosyltransferase 2-like domain-containing protein n=1 Tax=marine metagenome TaxID=408172 RepID=A0A381U0D5_9ZZZZ